MASFIVVVSLGNRRDAAAGSSGLSGMLWQDFDILRYAWHHRTAAHPR